MLFHALLPADFQTRYDGTAYSQIELNIFFDCFLNCLNRLETLSKKSNFLKYPEKFYNLATPPHSCDVLQTCSKKNLIFAAKSERPGDPDRVQTNERRVNKCTWSRECKACSAPSYLRRAKISLRQAVAPEAGASHATFPVAHFSCRPPVRPATRNEEFKFNTQRNGDAYL